MLLCIHRYIFFSLLFKVLKKWINLHSIKIPTLQDRKIFFSLSKYTLIYTQSFSWKCTLRGFFPRPRGREGRQGGLGLPRGISTQRWLWLPRGDSGRVSPGRDTPRVGRGFGEEQPAPGLLWLLFPGRCGIPQTCQAGRGTSGCLLSRGKQSVATPGVTVPPKPGAVRCKHGFCFPGSCWPPPLPTGPEIPAQGCEER